MTDMASNSVETIDDNLHRQATLHAKNAKYAVKALIAATTGYALDGFDLLILGFILPSISLALHLSSQQASSLVTWTLIGAVMGGFIFGYLSDRFGRVNVLSWSILLFAVCTGLCAFSSHYWSLLIWRWIAGLGLGGEFGIGMTLASEACSQKLRNRMASYVALGWQVGVLAAALCTPLLLPYIGWRGMFLVGVLPALFSFFVRYSMEEPATFHHHQRANKPKSNPFKTLFADLHTAKMSFGIIILTSVQNFGYFGLMIWMPSYLSQHFSYSLTQSALWTACTIIGMAFGIWLFGQLADRVGRRRIFITFQIGAVIMVFLYAQLTTPYALLFGGAIMGIFVNGMLGGYGALIADNYPTSARATAQNVLFNVGRGVGALGPIAIAWLMSQYSFHMAIVSLAALYLLDIIAMLFLIPAKNQANIDTNL